jgi:hypothetical protein
MDNKTLTLFERLERRTFAKHDDEPTRDSTRKVIKKSFLAHKDHKIYDPFVQYLDKWSTSKKSTYLKCQYEHFGDFMFDKLTFCKVDLLEVGHFY